MSLLPKNNIKSHDIRSHFNIPEDVHIILVIATENKGIFKAFELMAEKITGSA